MMIKYTQYRSAAGRLLFKENAPRCSACGRVLWMPIHICSERVGSYYFYPNYENGKRLGYVPNHRTRGGTILECWNGKACERRRQQGGGEHG